jgi:hypothetical protein
MTEGCWKLLPQFRAVARRVTCAKYEVVLRRENIAERTIARVEDIAATQGVSLSPCYIRATNAEAQLMVVLIEVTYSDVFGASWVAKEAFAGPAEWDDRISP